MEEVLTHKGQELIVKPKVNETFAVLNNINVNNKIKTKMGLNYLSWAYAWGELLKNYPDATFNVYNRTIETAETITTEDKENGVSRTVINKSTQEVPYFTDGRTCFVKVGVTVNGIEYVEYFPIMGLKNDAIPANRVTMTDVNKAIQRAFVKACARHGLGLYIYAGEDLPETEKNAPVEVSTSNDFATVKKDVINLAQKLLNSAVENEVSRYIQEMFPGIRLSNTTEEYLDKLIAARTYLANLQDNLEK